MAHCCELTVAVCSRPEEPISGNLRYNRVKDTYQNIPQVTVVHITEDLPSSSESSREISQIRSTYLKKRFPKTDVIFSSELYGDYVAEYMGITHCLFDLERTMYPIS
ncbi:hypothetical protein KA405_05155 [Patescibacteria group bacterium]|nr:hypothetical protein [Patescibacteria group bacterium]